MLGTELDARDLAISKIDRFCALMEILFESEKVKIRSK